MFLLGRLTILVDGSRCKDKNIAYYTIFYELESNIKKEIKDYWLKLPNQEKDKIIQYILIIENGLKSKRKPEAWICNRSAEAMTRYFEKDPECNNCTEEESNGFKTIIVPTNTNKEPLYIDDKEWEQKRKTMIDRFLKSFSNESSEISGKKSSAIGETKNKDGKDGKNVLFGNGGDSE